MVLAGKGPILVIAGAGSGKTRTLIYRVSRLIESGHDPSRILLLTFTNKAAREMLRRVEAPVRRHRAACGAARSTRVGNRLLRRYGEPPRLPPELHHPRPEDAGAAGGGHLGLERSRPSRRRFPRATSSSTSTRSRSTRAARLEVLLERAPHFAAARDRDRVASSSATASASGPRNAMDYDDLLLSWKRLLDENAGGGRQLSRRCFDHVLVDEYQDTNRLQADIVDGMAGSRSNVMVVGDDAQSIYSFRGASFENILGFPRALSGRADLQADAQLPLDAADPRARQRLDRRATAPVSQGAPARRGRPGRCRRWSPLPTSREQARFVAQRLLELRDEGESSPDLAVLYRAHHQALELQMELTRRGIPYEIRSGTRFFEQRHVKDVLAFLRSS